MLRQRVVSAAVLAPPLVLALVLGGPWIAAVVVVATAVGAVETFRLLGAAGYRPLPRIGTALAVALVVEAALPATDAGKGLLLVAVGVVLVAVGAFGLAEPRDGLAAWVATVFGAVYVSLLGWVVRLGEAAPDVVDGAALAALGGPRGWIVLLVAGVWAYDTGAYFAGRRFGRRRFLTHLSPSKTYAGLVGGLVAATVAVGAVLVGLGEPPAAALLVGPLVALAAQAGDLVESMLKRAAGAKDSSGLIPGHGGVLDRIDSFLFAAPALTLYVTVAYR